MSNPAVIILVDTPTKSGGRFKVEDNIGEAIHIHYNNFRIDLTIEEFLNFTTVIEDSLKSLINNETFDIKNFDPNFLHDISHMLINLDRVSFDDIQLSDLSISRKGFLGVPKWASLEQSRVYRAINGDTHENNDYVQNNYFDHDNQDRVNKVKSLVKQKSYPFDNEYIVLLNKQNFIRDGQHRASSILSIEGDCIVPVMRLHFSQEKHNVKHNLWVHSFFPVFKAHARKLARKIINRIKGPKF